MGESPLWFEETCPPDRVAVAVEVVEVELLLLNVDVTNDFVVDT
jgi:hypothetical protein